MIVELQITRKVIELKVLPARNGDAVLIKASDGAELSAVLIDGGYSSTFTESIRPELQSLVRHGYGLDLVVASHIDADHILGLISLFRANGDANSPKVIPIKQVWHNSLRSLTGYAASLSRGSPADEDLLLDILSLGFPPLSDEEIEISAKQGSSLAALLLAGGYKWNSGDGTKAIGGDNPRTYEISSILRITTLGPRERRMNDLREWWISQMRRLGYSGAILPDEKFDDAFEFMISRTESSESSHSEEISNREYGSGNLAEVHLPDESIINGSSISLIVEHQSVRILLLADSWANDLVESLLPLSSGGARLIFDAIKISHHGSARNTSPALLDLIDSPRYLISTNGDRHNHPDIEVLKAIVDRPATFQRKLYFNYATLASHFMKSYSSDSGGSFVVLEGASDWIQIETSTTL